jgi:carboxylesterase
MSQTTPTPDTPLFFSEPEHRPFEMGAGPAGALLIHGFMGTPAEMRPLAERLIAAGLSVRGPLLPGFGPDVPRLAQMDRGQWLATAAADWAEVLAAHEQAVLIGFSMGAAVALHLAAVNPPDALILIAPFWRAGGWQFGLLPLLRHVVPSIAPFEKADFSDPDVRRQMATMAPGVDLEDEATQQFLREEVRLPLSVLDELRRLGKEAIETAPSIQVPTLVIQGQQDAVVDPRHTKQLVDRLPRVTYRPIPGDHSFMHLDAPGTYPLEVDILTFLAALGLNVSAPSPATTPVSPQ